MGSTLCDFRFFHLGLLNNRGGFNLGCFFVGQGTLLTFGEPGKTSLKTSFQEFIPLRTVTDSSRPGLFGRWYSPPPHAVKIAQPSG